MTDGAEDMAVQLIREVEGCELEAYRDSAGKWTIGIGHLLDEASDWEGESCTPAAAEALLRADLATAWDDIEQAVELRPTLRLLGESLPEAVAQDNFGCVFAALLSWVFNFGRPKLLASDLLRHLNAGDLDAAELEFPKWRRAKGKINSGLVWRRAAERALFRGEGLDEALRVWRDRDREELTKWA